MFSRTRLASIFFSFAITLAVGFRGGASPPPPGAVGRGAPPRPGGGRDESKVFIPSAGYAETVDDIPEELRKEIHDVEVLEPFQIQ
jgi:hypothetical protein